MELPDGKILPEDWLLDKLCEYQTMHLSREKVKEVLHALCEHGSDLCRFMVIGDETDERKMRIEFMKDDLDASKNPALNN
jgi:hypothetical protein